MNLDKYSNFWVEFCVREERDRKYQLLKLKQSFYIIETEVLSSSISSNNNNTIITDTETR
jgi:hypothetical protein